MYYITTYLQQSCNLLMLYASALYDNYWSELADFLQTPHHVTIM